MWRRTWARSTDPSVRDDPSAAAEPLARRRFALPTIAMPRDGDQAEIDPADEDQRELLIVAEHPQYRHVLDDSFSDEQVNGVNPRLHVVMHWIIATPLCDDTPPLVRQAAERLLVAGHDRHDILHALAGELSHERHPALTRPRPRQALAVLVMDDFRHRHGAASATLRWPT